jgi:hypothetical protein
MGNLLFNEIFVVSPLKCCSKSEKLRFITAFFGDHQLKKHHLCSSADPYQENLSKQKEALTIQSVPLRE